MVYYNRHTRILHPGSKAHDKRDSMGHGLKDPHVDVVSCAYLKAQGT